MLNDPTAIRVDFPTHIKARSDPQRPQGKGCCGDQPDSVESRHELERLAQLPSRCWLLEEPLPLEPPMYGWLRQDLDFPGLKLPFWLASVAGLDFGGCCLRESSLALVPVMHDLLG